MNTFTPKQESFLADLYESVLTLGDLMQFHSVTPVEFVEWQFDREFRRRVSLITKAIRRKTTLDIHIGAQHAAQVLYRGIGVEPNLTPSRHRACVDLIKLSRERKPVRKSEKPRRDPPAKHTRLDAPEKKAASFHDHINPTDAQSLMKEIVN
jgi:hypothetical protein